METKARPKPITSEGKADAEVIYDGTSLRFAHWENREFLEQAIRQAKWLAQWLSSAVGEIIIVKPVLALPGWLIKRVGRGPVQVISGRDAGYLARPDNQLLSPALHPTHRPSDRRPLSRGRATGVCAREKVTAARAFMKGDDADQTLAFAGYRSVEVEGNRE